MDSTTGITDGPLHGIRVVEMGVWVAGPAAGGYWLNWARRRQDRAAVR